MEYIYIYMKPGKQIGHVVDQVIERLKIKNCQRRQGKYSWTYRIKYTYTSLTIHTSKFNGQPKNC